MMSSYQSGVRSFLTLNRKSNYPRLEEHMRFICPECGKENDTQLEWRKHLNVQHFYASKTVEDFGFKEIDANYHECQVCMKWVANAHQVIALLQYHRFLHLPYARTYQCRYCKTAFTRKKALCEHLYRNHNSFLNEVDKEHKTVELNKISFDEPIPKHNKEFYMKYLCPLCGKVFGLFNVWQHHIDTAHSATSVDLRLLPIPSTRNYYCEQCGKTLCNVPSKTELQRHNFTHQPHPLYFKCSYCSTKKNYKTEILLHVVKSHKDELAMYKEYISKPTEWGGQADMDIVRELDDLLVGKKPSQSDILQKALQDSLIDLEEEGTELKFNQELALDVRNSEDEPNKQMKMNVQTPECDSDFDDEEFEELCNEIFEEIKEKCTDSQEDETTEPNRKRLKLNLNDPENGIRLTNSLQKEMQKYINYICPECGQKFEVQSLWRTHVFEYHNLANAVEMKFRAVDAKKTAFACLVCHQVQHTTIQSELRRHYFQHMPYQAYLKCAICTKTKSSKPKILHHLQYTHLEEIQRNAKPTTPPLRTMVKNFRCLDCNKRYAHAARLKTHCRQCPNRLMPLSVGLFNIEKNMKLVQHLKNASRRIAALLEEEGIDVYRINFPHKK